MKTVLSILAILIQPPTVAHGPFTSTTISVHQADTLMNAALHEAEIRKVALAIVIVDEAGRVVLSRRMDGALPHAYELALRKAKTAALIRASTKAAQEQFQKGDLSLLAIDNMLPIQGGLPVKHEGTTIGAIAASGSPAPIDEAVAQAGIDALVKHSARE